MGKRSDFERIDRDFYITPREAVIPLLPHLDAETRFVEPCAGDGALIDHLRSSGHLCVEAIDIEPGRQDIRTGNALEYAWNRIDATADYFITNPPWTRTILHPLIVQLSDILPTWLLFDADWKHTLQAIPFETRCRKIVSIGRVRWMAGTKHDGKDNCAWYLFDKPSEEGAQFFFRNEAARRPRGKQHKLTTSSLNFDEILGGEPPPYDFESILG